MEITLTQVSPEDEISIRTQKSEYRFCVINPSKRLGTLTGGLLGEQRRDAYFAGAILPCREGISDAPRLETGTRALFYVGGKHGVDRITTSVITQLAFRPSAIATACVETA